MLFKHKFENCVNQSTDERKLHNLEENMHFSLIMLIKKI